MQNHVRLACYAGFFATLVTGIFLFLLWRPRHQVELHTEHLLRSLERKNWSGFETFIAPDYHDQWQNDRAVLLERTREVFRFVRNVHFTSQTPVIQIEPNAAHWESRITVQGDAGDVTAEICARINSLAEPFDLEWKRVSGKPWDWKLVSVRNPALALPELGE